MKFKVFDDFNIFRNHTIEINPGYTALVGPNGAGKTTLSRTIRDCIKNRKYHKNKYADFDAAIYVWDQRGLDDLGSLKQSMLMGGDIEGLSEIYNSSEGQSIRASINLGAKKLSKCMREAKDKSIPLMIFFDAIDSGLSIDTIDYIRNDYIKTIIDICEKESIEVYVIVCANNYEFVEGADCIYPRSMTHYTFNTYDEYKKFIMRCSKRINK